MFLSFHGGAQRVTGACYLLESAGAKILVDCGLFQEGESVCSSANYNPFPFNPAEIKAVFLTHGHLDHSGRLPKLIKEGFRGKIYSTLPSRDFALLVLEDNADILRRSAKEAFCLPVYDKKDVADLGKYFFGVSYGDEITVGGFKARVYNSGHILGSASYVFEVEGKKVVITGDLGNSSGSIIKSVEYVDEADYAVIEATYGNKIHKSPAERRLELERAIENTVRRGGVIMIPAFAIERTQKILFELNELVENKRIPSLPMFLDSPLSIRATAIYRKYESYYNYIAEGLIKRGDDIFDFPGLKLTKTKDESKAINDVPPPKLIIAGSGMSQGGRILHHEKRYLSDSKNLLLIVGYQVRGSRGRALLEGARSVNIFDEKIPVRCEIKAIGGYSAHADQRELLKYLDRMRRGLKKVFAVQSEADVAKDFATAVKDKLGLDARVPAMEDRVEL